jgi:hypothetical protein
MPWDAITRDSYQFVQIEDDVVHVVKEIARLWPELKVQYIERPELGEQPYRVVEMCKDGVERPVLTVTQLDDRLLDMLHQCDAHKSNILTIMDANNREVAKVKAAEDKDWREAAKDVMKSFAKSPKGRWSFEDTRDNHEGEIITIDDQPGRRTIVPDYKDE